MICGSSGSASSFLRKRPTCTSIVRSKGPLHGRASARAGSRATARVPGAARRRTAGRTRRGQRHVLPCGPVRRRAAVSSSSRQSAACCVGEAARHRGVAGHTPQHGLDARQQLAQVERLGHVVVGADLEAHHLVHRIAAARHDDEAAAPVFAQLARDRETVFAGQPQIQQHERGRVGGHQLHQRAAVVQLRDSIALAMEVVRPAAG